MDIFTVTLGLCSENRVAYDEFSRSFVNTASVGRVRIWLGEGDICLCGDVRRGRIAGMCGCLYKALPVKAGKFEPFPILDGTVTMSYGGKLLGAMYINYSGRGIYADKQNNVIWFGKPQENDIAVRVCKNLIICMKNGELCGAVIENIVIDDEWFHFKGRTR